MDKEDPVGPELKWRTERAMCYMIRWAEPKLEARVEDPHDYGRAVDGLLKGEAVTGKVPPEKVIEALRARLFACTENELGFPFNKGQCDAHDLREVVQAFLELGIMRGDEQAFERLGKLLDSWTMEIRPDVS